MKHLALLCEVELPATLSLSVPMRAGMVVRVPFWCLRLAACRGLTCQTRWAAALLSPDEAPAALRMRSVPMTPKLLLTWSRKPPSPIAVLVTPTIPAMLPSLSLSTKQLR